MSRINLLVPAGAAFVFLLGAIALNIYAGRTFQDALQDVIDGRRVIAAAHEARSHFQELDFSERLFRTFPTKENRDSMTRATEAFEDATNQLSEFVAMDPKRAERGSSLRLLSRQLVEDFFTRHDQMGQSAVPDPAQQWAARYQIFDQSLRDFVSAEEAEVDRLTGRSVLASRVASYSVIVCIVFAGIGTLSGGIVLRNALRELERSVDLEAERREAIRSEQQKSEFLANMSHEIRTPMNSVLGFADLLRKSELNTDQTRYVEAIQTGGASLLSLINDILDLSKIEAGHFVAHLGPTSLEEVFSAVRVIFENQAREKGLELTFEISPDFPAWIVFEPTRLRQILLNLVGNALKFTAKGSIRVSATAKRTDQKESLYDCTISVADTGCGIAPADLERIFKPFEQARRDTRSTQPGTGLGLSITRRLTEFLHGSISAQSELGKGSTFTVTFQRIPLSEPPQVTATQLNSTTDLNQIASSTFLIADDVPLNRDLLAGIFRDTHHSVLLAEDGARAVSLARSEKPDAILLDLRMPGLDGREARGQIKADPTLVQTPVIAVTASSMRTEEEGLRAQFDGYLRKPFTVQELYAELARLLPLEDSAQSAEPSPVPPPPAPQTTATEPTNRHAFEDWKLTPEERAKWSSLLSELEAERPRFEAIVKQQGHQDIQAFGLAVEAKGEHHTCPPVAEWGRLLCESNQRFAITATEVQLKGFPKLLDRLREHLS